MPVICHLTMVTTRGGRGGGEGAERARPRGRLTDHDGKEEEEGKENKTYTLLVLGGFFLR